MNGPRRPVDRQRASEDLACATFDHAALESLRPVGGFRLILADPNWRYEMRAESGYVKSPQAHYKCEPVEAIAAIPVERVSAFDSVLVLWAVNPMIPEALRVMRAWGFDYVTKGEWLKRTKRDAAWQMGTGYVLRGSTEPFLIGKRGDGLRVRDKGVRGILDAPEIVAPVREHSRKPDQMFDVLDRLFGPVPRLEMFARQRRIGWAAWGDDLDKFGEAAV